MKTEKKYKNIFVRIEVITPKKAMKLLSNRYELQRVTSSKKVNWYAHALKKDLWKLSNDAIAIDCYGKTLNGHHRLLAITQANKPMQTLVLYGIPTDTYQIMDCGKPRCLGDVLKFYGEIYSKKLAGSLNLYSQYTKKQYGYGAHTLQAEEALSLLKKNPNIRDSIKKTQDIKHLIPTSIAAFLYYIFKNIDKEKAEMFFEKLKTGEGFKTKSPIRMLRDQLWDNKNSQEKMRRPLMVNIVIKTWNLYRYNKTTTRKIKWRANGKPEDYVRAL